MRPLGCVVAAAVLVPAPLPGQWLDQRVPSRPDVTPSAVDAGRVIYDRHCWYCHGEEGDGAGPVASYLWPRPRDFTIGSYKLRTTASGELPTDEDLYRTISRGIAGTGMPAWGSTLSERERWQVIAYIKTLADGLFEDEEFDPYRSVIEVGTPDGAIADLVEAGRNVFERSDCWECHGHAGRGDGPKAPELADDWGFPLWATDLEAGWKFKGGSRPRDIYVRLSTGLDGSPMPSYAQTLSEQERWQVAFFAASLVDVPEADPPRPVVIAASRVRGALPEGPDAGAWREAPSTRIPMTGQATFAPRWQTPAVTDLVVQALHDDDAVAIRLQWNDRSPDLEPGDSVRARVEGWTADDTYPVLFPDGRRTRGRYADAVEVMFPADASGGPALPHFVYGDAGQPVDLWRWGADSTGGTVTTLRAEGPEPPMPLSPDATSSLRGTGRWNDGRWTVVVRRSLAATDGAGTGLAAGRVVPVAFHAWDGGHGETGLRMSLSSWYYLYLAEPVRGEQYLLVLAVVLAVAAVEAGAVRWFRARG